MLNTFQISGIREKFDISKLSFMNFLTEYLDNIFYNKK